VPSGSTLIELRLTCEFGSEAITVVVISRISKRLIDLECSGLLTVLADFFNDGTLPELLNAAKKHELKIKPRALMILREFVHGMRS